MTEVASSTRSVQSLFCSLALATIERARRSETKAALSATVGRALAVISILSVQASPSWATEPPSAPVIIKAALLCIETMETRNLGVFENWSSYSKFRWVGEGLIVGIGGNPEPGSKTDWCIISSANSEQFGQLPFAAAVEAGLANGAFLNAAATVALFSKEKQSELDEYKDVVALRCEARRAFLVSADSGAVTINTLPFRPNECE